MFLTHPLLVSIKIPLFNTSFASVTLADEFLNPSISEDSLIKFANDDILNYRGTSAQLLDIMLTDTFHNIYIFLITFFSVKNNTNITLHPSFRFIANTNTLSTKYPTV